MRKPGETQTKILGFAFFIHSYGRHMDAEHRIFITGSQSIRLLRAARRGEIVSARPAESMQPTPLDCPASKLELEGLFDWLNISEKNPLALLAPNMSQRHWFAKTTPRVLSTQLPAQSFLELVATDSPNHLRLPRKARVFIEAPPLALLRVAQTEAQAVRAGKNEDLVAKLHTLAFACECCGNYSKDPLKPQTGRCHYDKPGTSSRFCDPSSMQSYLSDMSHQNGLKLARFAAKYAIDESGSPMETYINLAFTLPPRYAGLSMTKPLANKQLVVSEEVRAQLKHRSLRPDFQWPDARMLGEYLGDESHSGKPARVEDKNRLQDYILANYKPFFLMFDDVCSVAALNRTALMFAKQFAQSGKPYEEYRIRRLLKDEGFLARQTKLVLALLPPLLRLDEG